MEETKKMEKIWVNKATSFADAEKFDEDYYFNLTSLERLEIMQFLRESYYKIKKDLNNESRKGLRRVVKVIKQK